MRSRKAGFPFAVRARKRELCLQRYASRMTLTESCQKLKVKLKVKMKSQKLKVKKLKVKIKVKIKNHFSLESTFLQCSCYCDHYESKIFFGRIFSENK